MGLTRRQRLALFFRRLEAASAADSALNALDLLRTVLNHVEDEHSGVPYAPANWRMDRRLYPPLDDNVSPAPNMPGVLVAESLQHTTYLGPNGAIRVFEVYDAHLRVVFEKPGADGKVLGEP